ncbi:FtsQ-type POTRA domain-containing protein [Leucobacter sp. CSA1]|uniref:FtsQ-type POTRA domain-containing protein n=1 Tax=Leucobacter chromiisoli TaxID=2796471 RepID=A0A934Q8T1_9MICO|nr:FtsQ-type POTRA domain-containing protein [Leucobacter chromiisoli]MBK0419206.1 FtsQ-type POTRA domain-containing protein [Leucobacter chromiisoli]
MKRPGGFDGAPEPRRGADSQGSGSARGGREPGRGGSGSESDALDRSRGDGRGAGAAQAGLDRLLRRFGGSEPRAPREEAEAEVAPTIDLSEVRRAREWGSDDDVPEAGSGEDGPGGGGSEEGPGADADVPGVPPAGGATSGALEARPRGLGALAPRRRASAEDPVRAAEREVRDATRRRRARERREQRRFSAQARRRRRNWLIAAGVVGGLVVFVAVGVLTPLMAVREVRVEGAALVNAEEVAGTLQRFDGVPLALVDDREVHEALEPFPLIQRYAIERIPPHTLLVRIEERVPVVSLERGGAFELYDPAGVLLGRSDAPPEGVPQGGDGLADVSSESFRAAAEVLRDMPAELRAQVSTASATSPQNVRFVLTSGVEVLWGDAAKSQEKAVVLATMLRALADRPVTVIDVSSSEAPVFR